MPKRSYLGWVDQIFSDSHSLLLTIMSEAAALWSLGPDRAAALRTLTVPQLTVLQVEIAEIVSEQIRRLEVGLARLDQQELEAALCRFACRLPPPTSKLLLTTT